MTGIWKMEEVDEYCDLFQTWRKAMLEAGYKLDEFKITISKKENK